MAFISQTLLNDNRLQLGREEFVRPHAFGGQWKKLRIGLHYALNAQTGVTGQSSGAGYFAQYNTFFYVGACQGVNGGYTNPSGTPDAVVLSPFSISSSRTQIITLVSSGLNAFQVSGNPSRGIWKSGTVETTATGGSNTLYGSCSPLRGQMIVDLINNQNNTISFDLYMTGGASNAVTDATRYQFLSNMEQDAPTNNITAFNAGTPVVTYNGNNALDCVCIYWERSQPAFEFSEIAVLRLY